MVVEGRVSMGYQESFRLIEHLAEAAGIKKAIEDYEHHPDLPEYCHYYCVSREKSTGKLYACIGGQRCRVHILAGKDLDYCVPDVASYADYFEDYDEALVDAAAQERPDLVDKGYREAAADFERVAEWERERKRKQRDAADALKPLIEAFLKENGPATSWELYSYIQHSEDHSVDDALRELEYRGYLRSKYSRSKYRYWFADDAIAGSYEDAMASAPSIEDKVVRALVRRGPSSVGSLSFDSEANETRVRKIVNSLVERGRAVVDKTSKPYIYSLVEGWQDTQPPDAA
jgi:hypothetical protein